MKLQSYFNQTKVATITVGENAVIGDHILSDGDVEITPGTYNIYLITNFEDKEALMIAQSGDFFSNIEEMDLSVTKYAETGTYGLASDKVTYLRNVDDAWEDIHSCETAYVRPTNDGDTAYSIYTNADNTAFFLDDQHVYMEHIAREKLKDDNDAEYVISYLLCINTIIKDRQVEVIYDVLDDDDSEIVTKKPSKRLAETIVDALVVKSLLTNIDLQDKLTINN